MSARPASSESSADPVAAGAYVAVGALNLGIGVAMGVGKWIGRFVDGAVQGANQDGAKGFVLGSLVGAVGGAGEFIDHAVGGIADLADGVRAAAASQEVKECDQQWMCVSTEVFARQSLSRGSLVIRTLDLGEVVRGTHFLHDEWGFPIAVKLDDETWVHRDEHARAQVQAIFSREGTDRQCMFSLLARMYPLHGEDCSLIVCDDSVNIRSSWNLNSPIVHTARRGYLLHGRCCIEYTKGHNTHFRVELDDGTWTSKAAGSSRFCKSATQEELHAPPDECALLMKIYQIQEAIDGDHRALDRFPEFFDRSTKDIMISRMEALEKEMGGLRKCLGAAREMKRKAATSGNGGAGGCAGAAASAARGAGSPRCFLPNTMLRTSGSTYIEAKALEIGASVVSVHGYQLQVLDKKIHEEDAYDIVELRTRGACLKVSATHRVVVPSTSGLDEKYARELQVGDPVMVHERCEPLVKKLSHKMRTPIVELRFSPDEPVECFSTSRWGVLTRGQHPPRSMPDTDDGFQD